VGSAELVPDRSAPVPRVARGFSSAVAGTRWLRPALWPVGIAIGIAAVAPTLAGHRAHGLDAATILTLVAGWSFMASGLVAWKRREENRVGVLMVGIGFLYIVPDALRESSGSMLLASSGLLAANWFLAAFAYLLVAFPSGRAGSRLDRFLVACVVLPAVPLQALWMMFLPIPNALQVHADAGVATVIDDTQRIVFFVAVVVLPAVLLRRWLCASPPLRRVLDPVLFGAAAILLFGLYVVLDKIGAPTQLVDNGFRVVLAAVPIMFLLGLLRARLARSAIGDLLVDLREPARPDVLRDALARAVRDPSLALAYWVPEYAGYVGIDGRTTDLPPEGHGRVVTIVERRGQRVAALIHDASLRDEPELVGAVCAAAGIALENERLQADLRARLEELRGSRARLVETGDAERRRLERDLHDGAQQRLVSIALELRRVERRLAPGSDEERLLHEVRDELGVSLRELRELAQGIHPAVLSDHGLDVALESLVARAAVPVRLTATAGGRLPQATEVAAYFIVSECLTNVGKYAPASRATVGVTREGDRLVVEVADDGAGGADPLGGSGLRGLADRVEALGGRLRVTSPPGRGTTVRAELPCA